MLQFNSEQIQKIRQRATQPFINQLKDDNGVILNSDTLVPPDARATWNLYYFCPDHGVRLTWDRNKPTEHCCPIDNQIFTGEPYDGAWWRGLNGLNAKACYELGLLWQLTGEMRYFDKVRDILLGYAKYYPDYEEHGGIPYNGPGKANAQTLCEANCHVDFARGYDFVRDYLTEDERCYIEHRLLCEGADFLMQHRSDQLHNHEMKISATIGIIGLIVNKPKYIEFALNSKYGLIYQLEHGVNKEGLWFEGSIHYHYYALQALMSFEKLAYQTQYSVKSHPNYYKMLAFPLKLVLPTGDFPRLNDCIAGQEKLNHTHLFEFAHQQFKDPIFAQALNKIYAHTPRNNIDALLHGVDSVPNSDPLVCQSIHAPESGLTIIHNEKNHNTLLLKHSPYGGEHDHYDRLGLIISRNGQEILPDLGTTGYGAEMHYGYYKNTATHNTLAVNQKNQPPANPKTSYFESNEQFTYISTEVNWSDTIEKLDSHTIVQWDEESYKDVVFKRNILWLNGNIDDLAIEINQITNPHQQSLDLIWHIRGKMQNLTDFESINSPYLGPLERLKECTSQKLEGMNSYHFDIQDQSPYSMHLYNPHQYKVITGQAPDNPATSDLSYLIMNSSDTLVSNVTIHDLDHQHPVKVEAISWVNNEINIQVIKNGIPSKISINLSENKISAN